MDRPYMFEHSDWFKPYVNGYYKVTSGEIKGTFDYYESLIILPIEAAK